MSIADAYNLGWKLALVLAGRAGAALLDSYSPERQPVGAQGVQRAITSLQEGAAVEAALGYEQAQPAEAGHIQASPELTDGERKAILGVTATKLIPRLASLRSQTQRRHHDAIGTDPRPRGRIVTANWPCHSRALSAATRHARRSV